MSDANARAGQIQESLRLSLESLLPLLKVEVGEAFHLLVTAKPEAAAPAQEALKGVKKVGQDLLARLIDEESADVAINNYMEAVCLIIQAEDNREKVKQYIRGIKRFNNFKRLFIALVRIGSTVAASYVGPWITALQLDTLADELIIPPEHL